MRNHVKFVLVLLSVAALSSFLTADWRTSGQQDLAGSDHAAFAELFNQPPEIVLANGGENPIDRRHSWLLAAKQDDDGDAEEDKEEKGDEGGGSSGFDRLWDVTCCG